jgi:hypothetical protein
MINKFEITEQKNFNLIHNIFVDTLNRFQKDNNIDKYNEHLHILRNYFQHGKLDPKSVYKICFSTFTLRYGFPNLIKNYLVIDTLYKLKMLRGCKNILDLGSGPGSFALAFMLWTINNPDKINDDINITMVEVIEDFLNLFDDIWMRFNNESHVGIKINKIQKFIKGEFLHFTSKPDMIVLSNALTEILRNPEVNIDSFIEDIIKSKSIILIIDYDYNTTMPYLKIFTDKIRKKYTSIQISQFKSDNEGYQPINAGKINCLFNEFRTNSIFSNANVKYLQLILVPLDQRQQINSYQSNIVEQYKRAWENHDMNLLRNLFSDKAEYHEKEGQRPFKGIESICHYWRKNKETQSSVEFHPSRINYNNGILSTDWQCTFYRKDLSKWMKLNGIFQAEIKDGKILRFKEKFEKKLTTTKGSI